MTAPLEIITFPGTGSIVHFIGDDKGFYADAGIAVNVTGTPNSVYQITNFHAGKYDIASTAIDNIVAYTEGQGPAELDGAPDFAVIMGGAQIELPFIVAADIASYDDLKGRSIALDALSTGFAFILYRMLDNAGLTRDDYTLASVGGTDKRWESLKAGEHAGALLNDPFSKFALDAGFRKLQSSLDVLDHYQAGIFAVRRGWARQNHDRLTAFVTAHLKILDWFLDPANRDESIEIMARHLPQLDHAAASVAVDNLMSPRTGFTPRAALDMAGIETVLALRSQYAEPKLQLSDPGKYLDLSYYHAIAG
jgi:ABC-type nitrate/sulfonate/bicarbonate transport system substrate-binding protein